MFFNRIYNKLSVDEIEDKIRTTGKIDISELEYIVYLGWEIFFKYNDEEYEVIQNGSVIELYCGVLYDGFKSQSESVQKFSTPKEFVTKAQLKGQNIAKVIDKIIILHC